MNRTAPGFALAASVFLLSSPLLAQTKGDAAGAAAKADAERAGKEGERLLEKHDAAGAIDQLGRAYNLSHNPRFLLPLGFAYAEAERPLDALDALGRFLKEAPAIPDAKRKEIGGRLGVMLDQVAALVTLEASRQNAGVKLDGRPIGNTPIETPLRLMPGKHEIVMNPAPTDPSSGARVVIEVKPGERRNVKLEPGARSRFLDPQSQNEPATGEPGDGAPKTAAQNMNAAPVAAASGGGSSEGLALHKKWWFWTGVGAVTVLAVGLGAGLGTRGGGNQPIGEEFPSVPNWPGGPINGRPSALITVTGPAL